MKPCRNGALAAGQGPGAERTPWTAPVTLPESSRIPWEWPCLPARGQACNAGVNSALSPRGGQPERTGVPRDTALLRAGLALPLAAAALGARGSGDEPRQPPVTPSRHLLPSLGGGRGAGGLRQACRVVAVHLLFRPSPPSERRT